METPEKDDRKRLSQVDRFWTKARTLAAQLVAEDELSDVEIARRIRKSKTWLENQKLSVAFAGRVRSIRDQMAADLYREGLAVRQNRLDALNDRWRRMQRVIEERSKDETMQNVPGGTTGLMVRTWKPMRDGSALPEYAVDTALMAEMRATEKQAAQELGEWSEKSGGDTYIDNRSLVLIREYGGIDPDQIE